MNKILSILTKWKKSIPSDLIQVVEYFGTPGSGKTYLSDILYTKLTESGMEIANKLPIDIGKMATLKRITVKVGICLYLIINNPSVVLNIVLLVREFHSRNNTIQFKLIFNLMHVLGVMLFCKKYNRILILDQGIFQAIWSCIFHGDNAGFNYDTTSSLLLEIFSKINLTNLLIVHIDVAKDKIKARLKTRKIMGTSLLNTGNEKMIEKGIKTTIEARIFLDFVANKATFLSVVDFNNN